MLYVDIEKVLQNFTLKIRIKTDGVITSLLGSSGAGKSMTLKCIAGIERPDRGRIVLDDRVLYDSEKKINLKIQERGVGYLFQDYALFPNMTVLGNIKAGLHRFKGADRTDRARALIESFHLKGLEHSRPATLSGGEKQRVALARIFGSEPQALLLDEPFSSLDTFLKWELMDELRERLLGYTGDVIMVSHDADEVIELCDTVYRIEDGASGDMITIDTFRQYAERTRSERRERREQKAE